MGICAFSLGAGFPLLRNVELARRIHALVEKVHIYTDMKMGDL